VQQVVEQLLAWGATNAREYAGKQESVIFSLPRELQVDAG
jgi:hypothetical protein